VNFSISEILVILVIALLVIKPDQLPGVAFSLGRFVKTMRTMFDKVKNEMNGIIDTVEKPEDKKREQQPE
jgi:Sec-independent protein translocase protein TatA